MVQTHHRDVFLGEMEQLVVGLLRGVPCSVLCGGTRELGRLVVQGGVQDFRTQGTPAQLARQHVRGRRLRH